MQPARYQVQKYYAAIIIIAVVAFWPIALGIFSLKYDAIVYFLPWRYHISEAIQNGEFPFWSPWLYSGLPLHADMQSGAWNPVVWFLSVFGRYNMFTLQIELMVYMVLGGIGFFKLSKHFNLTNRACLLCSSAYICNGFMIDSVSIIPWITSAAYMPFVFLYFLKLYKVPNVATAMKLSLSLTLLFTASYPSYFIITCYVLAALVAGIIIRSVQLKRTKTLFRFFSLLLLAALFTTIFCLPALISYVEFFPYYTRSGGVPIQHALYNPFHIKNLLSYISPIASYKIEAGNDSMSRNGYIGIFTFLFIFASFHKRWGMPQKIMTAVALFFFFFSLGSATPLRSFLYNFIPLMDQFRHPGNARIFTNGALILLSGFGIERMLAMDHVKEKRIFFISLFLLSAAALLLLFMVGPLNVSGISTHTNQMKGWKDHFSFSDLLFLSIIIQAIFLGGYYFTFKIKMRKLLWSVPVANLILFTWLSLPFNSISQNRTSKVVAFTEQYQKGFPLKSLSDSTNINIHSSNGVSDLGYTGFYNKKRSIHDRIWNRTINEKYIEVLHDNIILTQLSDKPMAFFETEKKVNFLTFSSNSFSMQTTTDSTQNLIVLQQFNHNWKAFVDNHEAKIFASITAFMKLEVPRGVHEVTFRYTPLKVIGCMKAAGALLVLFILYYLVGLIKPSFLSGLR